MRVQILAGYYTKFGELWGVSPKELAREAVQSCLDQANLSLKNIDAVYVGNMLSGILGGQEHLGAYAASYMGIKAPAFKIEGACASGGLAVHNAVLSIMSGVYKKVLVIGVEKMTDFKPEEITSALMGAGSDEERQAGATFPGLYALMAKAYMDKYGLTEEEMAEVAVKNHFHASLNPKAQYQNKITVEQVMRSSYIARPLKLLDCSPVTDGVGAIIIGLDQKSKIKNQKSGIFIEASCVATDSLGLSGRKSLTEMEATQVAAKKAYEMAGVGPKEIDVCEVHDCFTIAEIMALEDLGFYKKGSAKQSAKQTSIGSGFGGKIPVVNTSGGLKGCGHPVGATGVKQIVEIYDQLMGRCGKRQVEGARIGLTQNVGGSGATAVVHILKRY